MVTKEKQNQVSVGTFLVDPTVTHTESSDEFGDVEFIGYLGGSYDKFYGEISGVTNSEDDIDFSAKAGVKFTF